MWEEKSLLLNISDRIKHISMDQSRQLLFGCKNIPCELFCASSSVRRNTTPQIYLASEVGRHRLIFGRRINEELLRLL